MVTNDGLKNEGYSLDEQRIFESTVYRSFLNTLEKCLPNVFRYLNGQDTDHIYQSDFRLSYILIADITHYISILYKKGDLKSIEKILTLFDEVLRSSKAGKIHILSSFCEIIENYPDVLTGILLLMPQALYKETLYCNKDLKLK